MANPRAKAAMAAHWQIAHQQRLPKAAPMTRAAEEEAMARFIEERGVTLVAEPVLDALAPGRVVSQPARSEPMPGWR